MQLAFNWIMDISGPVDSDVPWKETSCRKRGQFLSIRTCWYIQLPSLVIGRAARGRADVLSSKVISDSANSG